MGWQVWGSGTSGRSGGSGRSGRSGRSGGGLRRFDPTYPTYPPYPTYPTYQADQTFLEGSIREHDRPPHMRHGAIVESQPFLRLLEVASDDVDKRLDRHLGIGVERVEIVHRHQARQF